MNQPLLSVIIPCYNVEKYLDKCISSIVKQVYSNLEILLVDDGSSDQTGRLCDTWQAKDDRIRVIHQQNQGASNSRKNGVDNATADYIAFVDSDDWIDPNMYFDLMTTLLTTKSDIAHCDFRIVYEDGHTENRVRERCPTVQTMDRIEGVIMVLEDHKWRTHLGCKIYKKTLFEQVEFPKGRVYGEDMIIHELFHRAAQSVFLDKEYYFYLVRSGSVSRQGNNLRREMKNFSDYSDAYFERYMFVNQHYEYHRALPEIKLMTRNLMIGLIRNMVAYPRLFTKKQYITKVNQLRHIPLEKDDKIKRLLKFELQILYFSPLCYKFFRLFYICIFFVTNKLKLTNKKLVYRIPDIWTGCF